MTQYEFAYLYFCVSQGEGALYNFRTNEGLKKYADTTGLPYVLQQLSAEGWQVVHSETHTPHGDNDYDRLVWLQREVVE